MHKLSVIIPAYNAEKYIVKCLDSVLNQTYPNMEIIVINDGSSDGTEGLLHDYKINHQHKLIVINQVNKGVSEARNTGLDLATGDYIGFIDSDDYIELDMYEKLMSKATDNDYDIVACDVNGIYPNKTSIISSGIDDGQNRKKLLIDAYAVLWNKVYKKKIIGELRFKPNVWYEDVLFLYQLYPRISKCGSVHECLHNYVQNENSITYTYNEKLYNLIENMMDIINYYKDNQLFREYADELEYSYVRYLYATFIKRLAKSKDKSEFNRGVHQVLNLVHEHFPNYQSNRYIKARNGKSIYLRLFNNMLAKIIYLIEKDKMN